MTICFTISFKILLKIGATKAEAMAASMFYKESIRDTYQVLIATTKRLQKRMNF